MKVLVIAETNWIEDVALAQDLRSAYLLQLKDEGKINIAVPAYSLHEADGSLDKKITKRVEEIDNFLHFLDRVAQSKPYEGICSTVKNALKELKSKSLEERGEIKRVLNKIEMSVDIIPYTMTVVLNADLRSESAIAPFKEADCRIYESILEFIRSNGGDYDIKIFYTRDREDFNDEMIYAELEDVEVELYFDAGAVIERVYEVLG
jgi:hypothetical protein